MAQKIKIGEREIGEGAPVFVVAELSANHQQNFETALRLMRAAKEAGADAVKTQTYTPETITMRSQRDCFRIGGGTLWDGRTLYDLYAQAFTPWEWQPKLKAAAEELGMQFFSSAFDPSAVEFLEKMKVAAHKVASFELTDIPLIQAMARTGKPVILSTGMATMAEIEEAVQAARVAGGNQMALLRCNSAYPAPAEEMNLRSIGALREKFKCPVGLSDHTLGIAVPVAAVTLGASIIEKHFTLARSDGGPDAAFSLEPQEFKAMVDAVRTSQAALGEPCFAATEHERASLRFRRSLFVVRNVKKGERFTVENVRSIRPADGMHPRHLPDVLSCAAAREIEAGTPLEENMIERSRKQAK